MYYQPSQLHLVLRTSYLRPDHHPDIILFIQGATHKFNINMEHPYTKILDFDVILGMDWLAGYHASMDSQTPTQVCFMISINYRD